MKWNGRLFGVIENGGELRVKVGSPRPTRVTDRKICEESV
jgi:hypothetical protein